MRRLTQFVKPVFAFQIGDKGVLPMPRVCSHSIMYALSDVKPKRVQAEDLKGPIATIVRDPFDRLVSAYHLLRVSERESFAAFVQRALFDTQGDIHVWPQTRLLPKPDWIGRYSNLEEDWRRLCDWLEIPYVELDNKRTSQKNGGDYYTPELRKRVAEYYRDDLEAGYGD